MEDGKSFKENALTKARFASKLISYSYPTVADDSGLCINSLGGAPGIFSSRWAYNNNYSYAFEKIKSKIKKKGLNVNKHKAKFVCVLALIDDRKNEFFFRGTLKGEITFPPCGENGFGYDPIFVPYNYEKTLAQLSFTLKNKLSHRKKAIEKMLNHCLFQTHFSKR